jgi:hypothetical protein
VCLGKRSEYSCQTDDRSEAKANVPETIQAVEKVVVGPVGGPKDAQNKVKTLTKTSYSTSEPEAEKSAKEFFNTLDRYWYTRPLGSITGVWSPRRAPKAVPKTAYQNRQAFVSFETPHFSGPVGREPRGSGRMYRRSAVTEFSVYKVQKEAPPHREGCEGVWAGESHCGKASKSVFCKVYAPLTSRFSIRRIIAISMNASLLWTLRS